MMRTRFIMLPTLVLLVTGRLLLAQGPPEKIPPRTIRIWAMPSRFGAAWPCTASAALIVMGWMRAAIAGRTRTRSGRATSPMRVISDDSEGRARHRHAGRQESSTHPTTTC